MKVADFSFNLPPELIAQNPVEPRDQARLLVFDRLANKVYHQKVADLPSLLPAHSVLVANNSKVRRSRLWAQLDTRPIEILIIEPVGPHQFRCLIGGRRIKQGSLLTIYSDQSRHHPTNLTATVTQKEEGENMATFILTFEGTTDLEAAFAQYGETPLPPYITNSTSPPERYQTVYAQELGSAAAPTAGLHFTPELIEQLRVHGMTWEEVTLHVGLGTFLPLRQETVEENHLHHEQSSITSATASILNQTSKNAQAIIPIGTTSTRTLESHWHNDALQPGWQSTNLFIYPGYIFQTCNGLLTNFHLPHSSLLLLVAAMLGNHPHERRLIKTPEEMATQLRELYALAIAERYRFYSFGDAMLIL